MKLLENLLEKTPEFRQGVDNIISGEKSKFDNDVDQNKFAIITLNEKFYLDVMQKIDEANAKLT